MPESIEIELYRRLAERALDRRVVGVDAPDAWFLKDGLTGSALASAVIGRRFTDARRIGKLLLLDTDGGPTVGLRFGMTGRLLVDGVANIDDLQYSSMRDEPAWDRVTFLLDGGGDLRIRDPRRLGAVQLDPDEGRLGPDVLSISPAALRHALAGSTAPVKARLLDQARVAGVGNLIADEVLWRAGVDPARQAGSLSPAEVRRLHKHLRATVDELMLRGGSHTGDAYRSRAPGGRCPKDGTPMVRRTVGGRTTWSCPRHQR
ncbi:MAG: DNA-formamidopyrimidine glycosylase [Actinomycetia bacterium]|nr:DNA-formamidopyrimidine glycosylase [Actinomycetes bacterium]